MKVREVMTAEVFTVRPEATFEELVGELIEHDVSGLPVVDERGRLVGIVTEADLVSKEAYPGRRRRPMQVLVDLLTGDARWVDKAKGLTAESLMSSWPLTIRPDDDVAFAARRMLGHRVKRLPVVDSANRLVGIVSRHDLLRAFPLPEPEAGRSP